MLHVKVATCIHPSIHPSTHPISPSLQLSSAQEVLEKSHQPYSYLIESIRVRDDQLATARGRIAALEEDLK